MSLSTFLERVIVGKQVRERRVSKDKMLDQERQNLNRRRTDLAGEVRQNAEIASSGTRVMDTMVQAMVMMESTRGTKK